MNQEINYYASQFFELELITFQYILENQGWFNEDRFYLKEKKNHNNKKKNETSKTRISSPFLSPGIFTTLCPHVCNKFCKSGKCY